MMKMKATPEVVAKVRNILQDCAPIHLAEAVAEVFDELAVSGSPAVYRANYKAIAGAIREEYLQVQVF